MSRITTEVADRLLQCARDAARALNCRMSIALCDSGGHLIAFSRMDGAFAGSADIAQRKAHGAVMFEAPTELIGNIVREHQLVGFEQSNAGLMLFGGGFPLTLNGALVGGIGVSGGSAQQDVEVAQAALALLQEDEA